MEVSDNEEDTFTGKVSNYSNTGRRHIEVPQKKIERFKAGDPVYVVKLKDKVTESITDKIKNLFKKSKK